MFYPGSSEKPASRLLPVELPAQPDDHASSFLIAYTAFTSVLDAASVVRSLTGDSAAIALFLNEERRELVIPANTLLALQQTTYALWFPFQQKVANAMGDVHTRERPSLVTVDDLRQLKAKMEPGDIILERRNWNIGNVGMPGFWSHAAIYTGTLAQLDEYFAGQRNLTDSKPFSEYIAEKFPRVRAAYDARAEGEIPGVIEVVCTELVFKAYEPRAGKPGIRFPLENITGRTILPPHGIAHMFDREFGTPGQQLDFIGFYDGVEAEGCAHVSDVATFCHTWQRLEWDIAQQ